MQQSRRMSLVESVTNVVIGYALAVATQAALFPLLSAPRSLRSGIHIALADDLLIGLVFLVVSLVRSYALRRIFETLR